MAEGRQVAEWGRTSSLMALLANCHRDPKRRSRPFQPADFSPYPERREAQRRSRARGMPADAWRRMIVEAAKRSHGRI